MESPKEKIFPAPEDELALLRQETKRLQAEKGEMSREMAAERAVETYRVLPVRVAINRESTMPERQLKMTALGLSAEPHDSQIESLLALLPDKGVKNALLVAEKTGNPHVIDDFHRALVRYVASDLPLSSWNEKDPLWRPLHLALFEIQLPVSKADQPEKKLSELVSGMEQFYSGMIASGENREGVYLSIELAKERGSADFAFYIAVSKEHGRLLEKQALSIFPGARVRAVEGDYNIFNENGLAVAAYAKLHKNALYPLLSYQEFDTDPLNVILNSFSKIDQNGEGAAIQFLIGPREDEYAERATKAIEAIRSGEQVETALAGVEAGLVNRVAKEVFSVFKSQEKVAAEKEKKAVRAGNIDADLLEQFQHKLGSPINSVTLRVVSSANTDEEAKSILRDITQSFNQFENGRGNRLVWQEVAAGKQREFLKNFSFRLWNDSESMHLNLEEITTLLHFPPSLASRVTPELRQNKTAEAPAPLNLPAEGTLLGINHFRGTETPVRVTLEDRLRHFYIIGQTGTGKTTLMKNMIMQDIKDGHGVCFIDPHGTDIADVLGAVPPERQADVIYFDPAETSMVMGLNMLEFDPTRPEQKTFVVNELFSIFQKLYGAVPESMGPMFEQYFRNATLLVLEDTESGSTLLDISRVFADADYRKMKLAKVRNPVVAQFWNDIATKAGGEASLENIVPYITSKFDIFTANDIMRPIIGQQVSSFNFRQIMDERKILLVNLSKGRLGEINANLLGMIIVGKLLMAALSRVDAASKDYAPFFLHMDEFQNISTSSIAAILSEARKYKLGLTVAHQFIGQLEEKIRDAVFGNVGSLAAFRVGPDDAEFLENQFSPVFTSQDLMNIENRQAAVRILAAGTPTKPFNIHTAPPEAVNLEQVAALTRQSLETYAHPRRQVEMEISARYL
jgi:hypothetical protein